MTNEGIEKQAEEYLNSIPSTSGECKGSVYSEEKLKQAYKDGWLSRDGAEHEKGRWFVTPDYDIECVGLNSCAGYVNPLFVGDYKSDCITFIKKEIDGSKSEWHDLRKDPTDLPKKTGEYFTNIGLLYYDKLCDRYFWHTPSCEACDYSDEVEEGEVIAWCELPQFKNKE